MTTSKLRRTAPLALTALAFGALAGGAAARPAASIAFNPDPADFGTLTFSDETPAIAITVTNSGAGTGPLTVTVNGSQFSKIADSCAGKRLGKGKSCSVTVQYASAGYGSSSNGTLAVASTKPLANASVDLSGATGATPPARQLDCHSFGGTFGTPAGALWTCTGWSYTADNFAARNATLSQDCVNDAGVYGWAPIGPGIDSDCTPT